MAKWRVIETRDDLVTVERLGSAGMVSMVPASLGLKSGHDIALHTELWSDDDVSFRTDPAPHPQADPGDEGAANGG